MKKKFITAVFFVSCMGSASNAQDTIQNQIQTIQNEIKSLNREEKSHFMLRGFAQSGLEASEDRINFNLTSFNPVLLWRHGERFLFESELEMGYENNELDIHLGFANASYIISKGLVIRAGKFLIPFGTFGEKFHPSWINKFSTMPLGVGHDGIVPNADVGFEIRGGLQLGYSKLNYSFYAVNGPTIKNGVDEPNEAGMLMFENATDNNKNKAIGSRLGIIPFSNASLEIGVSGYYAMPGDVDSPFMEDSMNMDLTYKDVSSSLSAIDLSLVKRISYIKGIIDIKGQYTLSNLSGATYFNPEDTSRYTFANNSSAYYAQLAYRPAMMENNFLKNFELTGRYSVYNTPEGSLWQSEQSQIAIGLNYWLTWRTVIKTSYQSTTITQAKNKGGNKGDHGHVSATGNMFFLHFAVGL